VEFEGDAVRLLDGEQVVAEGAPGTICGAVPEPVSLAEARAAGARHVRVGSEVFRECFVCGMRESDDGLGIHVGAVAGREPVHAAPWTPTESAPEVVWAAIDCPGAYAVGAEGRGEVVLGRMTARIGRLPEVGEPCVVVAWPDGEEGRKLYAGTALYTAAGELLAEARQTWVVPRA
jgi:hypothetical protein